MIDKLSYVVLSRDLQLYAILEQLTGAPMEKRQFQSLGRSKQLWYLLLAVNASPGIDQYTFEGLSRDAKLWWIYENLSPGTIDRRQYESFNTGVQLYHILLALGVTVVTREHFLSLPRSYQLFYMYVAQAGGNMNTESDDYRTRIGAFGGSISDSTLLHADTLISQLKSAGVWNKLARMNLFLGDSLISATVPIRLGSGNSRDFATGFTGADYSEATGLVGGAGKFLNTGMLASILMETNTHLSMLLPGASNDNCAFGAYQDGSNAFFMHPDHTTVGSYSAQYGQATAVQVGSHHNGPLGHIVASRTSDSSFKILRNSNVVASGSTMDGSLPVMEIYAMANNNAGSMSAPVTTTSWGYSIGEGLTDEEITAFTSALAAFNAAIGRTP